MKKIPPPLPELEFCTTALPFIFSVPSTKTPPPSVAELPNNVLLIRVRVEFGPGMQTPPPLAAPPQSRAVALPPTRAKEFNVSVEPPAPRKTRKPFAALLRPIRTLPRKEGLRVGQLLASIVRLATVTTSAPPTAPVVSAESASTIPPEFAPPVRPAAANVIRLPLPKAAPVFAQFPFSDPAFIDRIAWRSVQVVTAVGSVSSGEVTTIVAAVAASGAGPISSTIASCRYHEMGRNEMPRRKLSEVRTESPEAWLQA